jgi:hypothetical protein
MRRPCTTSPPNREGNLPITGRKKSLPYAKNYLTNRKKFGKIHIEKKRKELMKNDDLV